MRFSLKPCMYESYPTTFYRLGLPQIILMELQNISKETPKKIFMEVDGNLELV